MFKAIALFFKRIFATSEKVGKDKILPLESSKNYYVLALSQIGVKEFYGKKHNPRIIEYHSTTTLRAITDETPWCSAFVNWCLFRCGLMGTNSSLAKSWLNYGKKTNNPEIGKSIVVLWRGRRDGWQGHVGFFAGRKNGKILILGGNQGNEVCYQYYKENKVLAYINP